MTTNQINEDISKLSANTNFFTSKSILHKKNTSQNTAVYLNLKTIQEILHKFLIEKNMSKENLAEILGLKINELEMIINNQASSELIIKVNLPLIKLFCETGFNSQLKK